MHLNARVQKSKGLSSSQPQKPEQNCKLRSGKLHTGEQNAVQFHIPVDDPARDPQPELGEGTKIGFPDWRHLMLLKPDSRALVICSCKGDRTGNSPQEL